MKKSKLQDKISESKSEFEIQNAETLFNYLNLKLENAVNYEDLYNLCYTLFCTLDILPENLKSLKLTKEVLAKTFIKLVAEKNVTKSDNKNKSQESIFSDISDEKHWIEKIRMHMIADKWPNIESAKMLLERN
ncbi:hypothetical protein [Flavobacterium marginilacus]|uniref:hypothetical protein n=1 Tax=Flavobacterium marginilacus TaxID=3003256 RepID=UPI00248D7373|nr:hypothetical protein [Flavobacterium marginilacus]